MTQDQILEDLSKKYYKKRDEADDVLIDAMDCAYKALVGAFMSDKLREAVWQALRDNPGP